MFRAAFECGSRPLRQSSNLHQTNCESANRNSLRSEMSELSQQVVRAQYFGVESSGSDKEVIWR